MLANLDLWHFAAVLVLGLVAGVLGGMLGVGGSVIMIPGLVLLFAAVLATWMPAWRASTVDPVVALRND